MFKKRGSTKTQTNLNDILTQINVKTIQTNPITQPNNIENGQQNKIEYQINNKSNININKNIFNTNNNHNRGKIMYNLQEDSNAINNKVGEQQQKQYSKNNKNLRQQKQKQPTHNEIQSIFAQFIQLQKQLQLRNTAPIYPNIYDNQQQQAQYNPFSYRHIQQNKTQNYIFQSEQAQYKQQQQQADIKPKLPAIHQVIIQDQSGDQIQIQQNYGQISSIQQDSQNYQDGLQNQIIKKTLTKSNYDRISSSLYYAHKESTKNKLLKQLQKVSFEGIHKKISKDLRMKQNRKNQLLNQIKFIDLKIKNKQNQIKQRKQNLYKMELDLDYVRRLLQIIYYFGNQLEIGDIDQKKLTELVKQPEWTDRINNMRKRIKKNKQDFDKRKNKKIDIDDENDGIAINQGSQGDVQQIVNDKYDGWKGWQINDQDGRYEQKDIGNNRHNEEDDDDDQCIQIQDD